MVAVGEREALDGIGDENTEKGEGSGGRGGDGEMLHESGESKTLRHVKMKCTKNLTFNIPVIIMHLSLTTCGNEARFTPLRRHGRLGDLAEPVAQPAGDSLFCEGIYVRSQACCAGFF